MIDIEALADKLLREDPELKARLRAEHLAREKAKFDEELKKVRAEMQRPLKFQPSHETKEEKFEREEANRLMEERRTELRFMREELRRLGSKAFVERYPGKGARQLLSDERDRKRMKGIEPSTRSFVEKGFIPAPEGKRAYRSQGFEIPALHAQRIMKSLTEEQKKTPLWHQPMWVLQQRLLSKDIEEREQKEGAKGKRKRVLLKATRSRKRREIPSLIGMQEKARERAFRAGTGRRGGMLRPLPTSTPGRFKQKGITSALQFLLAKKRKLERELLNIDQPLASRQRVLQELAKAKRAISDVESDTRLLERLEPENWARNR